MKKKVELKEYWDKEGKPTIILYKLEGGQFKLQREGSVIAAFDTKAQATQVLTKTRYILRSDMEVEKQMARCSQASACEFVSRTCNSAICFNPRKYIGSFNRKCPVMLKIKHKLGISGNEMHKPAYSEGAV